MEIAVLGAGTMGHGIAQVSAMAGHDVVMRDLSADLLEEGLAAIERNLEGGVDRDKVTPTERDTTLERIATTTDLEAAVGDVDLVVEAVPEDLDRKHEVFTAVENTARPESVLATNTSSLSVTSIANVLERPERAIGMHFFNPVHIMGLVEIVVPEQATEETVAFANDYVTGIGKEPIVVRDTPGFATSRLGVTLGVEAIRMVEQGVATPRAIDRGMELGYNHPMGPIELTDVVGLDVRLDVLEYLRNELGERFSPPQLLKRKVRAGKLGKKTGEGFYRWEDGEVVDVADGVSSRS